MTPSSVWEQLGRAIGQATDANGATGRTVIRGISAPFRCSAALLGRASGTREFATCAPEHLVDETERLLRSHATPTRFAQHGEAEGRRNTTPVLVAVSVPLDTLAFSQIAQAATEQAIERGVRTAHGRHGIPGLADNTSGMREERHV